MPSQIASFLSLTLASLGYVFLGIIEPSVLASFWFLMYLYVFSSVCPSAHLRAQSYAERLRLGLAVMHGEASQYDSEMVDGPQSPPLSRPATGHTGLELPCKTSRLLTSLFFFVPFVFNLWQSRIFVTTSILSDWLFAPLQLHPHTSSLCLCFLPLLLWSSSHCVSSSSSCQPSVFSTSSHPSCLSPSHFTHTSVYCYRWTFFSWAHLPLECGNFWSPL